MTIATQAKQAWDTSAYHRMTAARYDAGDLVVDFQDGTRARVSARKLLPQNAYDPDWAGMVVDSYELVVPDSGGRVEIPWSRIRLLTDPAFDAHWRAMAAKEDRVIGDRIAALRLDRGLTVAELARRAEVPLETLTRVEAGQLRADFTLLERLLAPVGATLDDLVVESASNAVPTTAGRLATPN
jgi:DNA-binding XRE family transcriptional regulator